MKKLLFLCAVLSALAVSAQTNTWTGAISQNWNVPGNWSLGLPGIAHDVVIPTGSTVNVNVNTAVNSIAVYGTATVTIVGTFEFYTPSFFEAGTTINWNSGSLTGGGTLDNAGTINLLTSANKFINGNTTLNNTGTMNVSDSGDLYIINGTVNNQTAGVIDLQADSGNLSYSAGPLHALNNFGLIRKTTSTGNVEILADLVNTGTLSVESGTLTLTDPGIQLNGGTYNVSAGCALNWNSTVTATGVLSGVINGVINWAGTVTVPLAATAQWEFTGPGGISWNSGILNGGGTLTNNHVIDLATAANKTVNGATTFNNTGLINIVSSGDLYVVDGTVNNQPSGVIDMQTDAGNLSYSAGGSHVLNNYGLIKRSTSTGAAVIENEFHNEGTIWVESGTLNLNNPGLTLQDGIYNVNAGAFLTCSSTVGLSGTLTGTMTGEMIWYSTISVAPSETATLAFTGTGNVNWSTGTVTGGGTLNNQFTMRLTTASNKTLNGGTTFNNSALIYTQSSGDLYIINGILNNLASGTIDLRSDAANLSYSSGASYLLNNSGTIRRTTSTGVVTIECDLVNTGTISVESGSLVLANPAIQLNGGTYNVSAGAIFEWQSTVTCSGTLNGTIDGTLRWTATTSVPTAATLDFTGSGGIDWATGSIIGGGALTSNFAVNLITSANKTINGGTTVNNAGTLSLVDSGDLYIVDGIVNNQAAGVIDLRADAANLSYAAGASHLLNNFGLIKKTTQAGVTQILCELNNSGTIDAQIGTIDLTGTFPFTNNADGVLAGVGTIDLPPLANFTNNGTVSPGGAPGTLNLVGPFEMESGAQIAVDLNGLTPGTGHDVLAVTGNATLNGSVAVTLGFAPAVNDSFAVATTTGLITTCNMAANTSTIRNGLDYLFSVGCVNDNQLVLTVVAIEAVPPVASSQSFCAGATVGDLEADGQNILWYDAASGGTPLDAGTLLATATYYVTQTIDGFESVRVAVSVTISTTPAPTAPSPQVFNDSATVADLEATGTLIQWFADVNGTPLAANTVLATGTYYVSQTLDGCESPRIAIAVTVDTENFFFYVDADLDGFGTGDLVEVEEGPTPPPGYSTNNTDCNDADNTVWQSANLFLDADGDGYDAGSETVCYGASVPTGYAETTLGSDCDDADNTIFQSASLFIDADGDGYDNGGETVCYGATVPTGYAETTLGSDCDDADNTIFQSASLFIDADGDGYDNGGETVCYGATVPTGYAETTLGSDCDDADESIFQSASLFIDADGDGYDNGNETICYGATVPTGYAETSLGTDCDDTDANVNLGAAEIAGNGIDDNCNGATDEGGSVVTTLTPASCGATLANINSLVGIVSLPGATAYRVRVTNTATAAQQTLVRSVPNFRMNMFASYDYAATYSVDIEVQMNGVFVGYYGPSCTVSTPAILAPGGAAQVTPSQCGITLAGMNTLIATSSLAGVTGYRFRVTNLTDTSAPNQVQTIDRTLHWFSLPMLATYTYGTTYRIEVAMRTNGDYTAFGNPCTVTTPAVPTLVPCGGTIETANSFVTTTSLQHATQYRFELTNTGNAQVTTVESTLNRFTFNQVVGYVPGQTYQVRVAVLTSGVWSLLGGVCTITAPGALSAKAGALGSATKVWPNPFTYDLTVDVNAGSVKQVKVFDMLGRLIEEQQIQGDITSFTLGGQYPSGVYNLIVSGGGTVQTVRIVKR
ncbi:T9SS type A sorting domain-containing protein [Flavobacterium caeni]|uniref:Por secretion system C-terminal sorting domain-containing protein n=1 Tax=Flavobacterium caeni TaxID=490189 RepID=A0A1G5HTV0_9FLAO|nr:T9SS type A sorting domain-containing protein [Flavobacterium caeni]SCY67226.1 Por secretion system C-terminal sorting domain-containing protein [Flavobacterium caeni]